MASSQSKEELEHNVRSHLKSLQLHPSKNCSFFNAPKTNYAAWFWQGLIGGAIVKLF